MTTVHIDPVASTGTGGPPPSRPSLSALAAQYLSAHNNERALAEEAMINDILGNPVLNRSLISQMVSQAVSSVINHTIANARRKTIKSMAPVSSHRRGAVKALARVVKNMLDLRLSNGKPLGESTYEEIMTTHHRWRSTSDTLDRQARFLAVVAPQVPAGTGKLAKEVLSVAEVNRIWRQTAKRGRAK